MKTTAIKYSQQQKNSLNRKLAKNNSKSIPSGKLDFDAEKFIDKSLLFDLKQTSKEQIFDVILDKIPDNDKYYIKHQEGKRRGKKRQR